MEAGTKPNLAKLTIALQIASKNQLTPGVEGSSTKHLPDGAQMSIYDPAMQYKAAGVPWVVIGDENFRPEEDSAAFDNWLEEQRQKDDDDDEEAEQAYEKVQVKVTFPPIQDLKNELVIERWLPWRQLHPSEEEEDPAAAGAGLPGGGE